MKSPLSLLFYRLSSPGSLSHSSQALFSSQPCCSSLKMFQHLNVLLVRRGPKLHTVQKAWARQSLAWGTSTSLGLWATQTSLTKGLQSVTVAKVRYFYISGTPSNCKECSTEAHITLSSLEKIVKACSMISMVQNCCFLACIY